MKSLPHFSPSSASPRAGARLLSGVICLTAAMLLNACGGGGATSSSRFSSEANGSESGLFLIAGSPGGPGALDGKGNTARFRFPQGVAIDAAGNAYVADSGNHTVRRVTPDGTVSTIAGQSGTPGDADGAAGAARFSGLRNIAIDGAGMLYVTDRHRVRRITRDGTVSTLAGSPTAAGHVDGIGAQARFDLPAGLAIDNQGILYVADQNNQVIRVIATDGTVSTLAGLPGVSGNADGVGAAARFNNPQGIAIDAGGALVVADRDNYIVRRVSRAGAVTTIAGTPGISGSTDGAGGAAQFFAPQGIAADSAGNLYVADAFLFPRLCACGANGLIRRIAADGSVSTLAGTSKVAGSQDGRSAEARFDLPLGIAVSAGQVIVADTNNHTLRRIDAADGLVSTLAGLARRSGYADGQGSAALFHDPLGITFVPGRGLAVTDASNLPDDANALVRLIGLSGSVTTLAGIPGVTGTGHADGPAASARFDLPLGVAADSAGNLYIADAGNAVIRRISLDGIVSTLAGLPRGPGSADGSGSSARFQRPTAIAADAAGNLYATDVLQDSSGNESSTVRRITPAGTVTTLAGRHGAGGDADGPGLLATFTSLAGIAIQANGGIVVADAARHVIRRIAADGTVTTVAGAAGQPGYAEGGASQARFNTPNGLAIDAAGNIYVADSGNHLVRRIAVDGTVTTVAGVPGVPGTLAGALPGGLTRPTGLSWMGNGTLAITSMGAVMGLRLP